LTEDDRASPDQFWNKNDRDLVYTGLNIKFVKAFLASTREDVSKWEDMLKFEYSKVQRCDNMVVRSIQVSPPFYILKRDGSVPQVVQEGNEESSKRRHVR